VALRVAATPERAFDAFTREIGDWWRANGLFQFTLSKMGRLAFEPGEGGRLIETYDDGEVFEIGRISVWEPPSRLVLSWRQASFAPEQSTEVHVRFEPAGEETRVVVEHFGWDSIPQEHVARHTFPLELFQMRHAEWWQALLASYKERLNP
jgi:uncharacterized protein YndB with AHSA1/START domain